MKGKVLLILVTAVVKRDFTSKGAIFHGLVVELYNDGTVWQRTEFTTKEGVVTYSKGKRAMTLDTLVQDKRKGFDAKIAEDFRAMYINRDEGYEVCAPLYGLRLDEQGHAVWAKETKTKKRRRNKYDRYRKAGSLKK